MKSSELLARVVEQKARLKEELGRRPYADDPTAEAADDILIQELLLFESIEVLLRDLAAREPASIPTM